MKKTDERYQKDILGSQALNRVRFPSHDVAIAKKILIMQSPFVSTHSHVPVGKCTPAARSGAYLNAPANPTLRD